MQVVTFMKTGFWLGGDAVPLDEPLCGFTGSLCDRRPYIYGGVGVVVLILLIAGLILARWIRCIDERQDAHVRVCRNKQELARMLWRIDLKNIVNEEVVGVSVCAVFRKNNVCRAVRRRPAFKMTPTTPTTTATALSRWLVGCMGGSMNACVQLR
jgi:hypothetical protein